MKKTFKHRIVSRYRKNRLLSQILSLTGDPLKNKKWIFIVGCYNSGTTLLDQILASHTQISGLPDEGVIFTNQLHRPEDFGWRRMWFRCQEELNNENPDSNIIKKHWSHFYDKGKELLLEKSIANTCRIPFILKNFAPVYIIHIVRNGYAVAEGIHRKAFPLENNSFFKKGHYPIELCIKQWTYSLEEVEKHKGGINNFLEISYEDLCENTEEVLSKVTNFLNIESFSKQILTSSFSVHEKDSKIRNMNERSISRLSKEDLLKINKVAADHLDQHGYRIIE